MDSFEFLLILRIALVAILYLAILQVVLVARRELRQAPAIAPGATSPTEVVGHLVVVDKGSTSLRPGQRLDIQPITTIGRAPTNSIVLDSKFVSVVHVRIIYRDRALWVEDVGGTNKAKLDGRDVVQAEPVTPGMILKVGDVGLRFTL
ncbi:MAG TPA: FHA domain-containing protein [Ktedonobacterales bacterium]|nr:FHA domain-containing protein [Ktedonobacterales bacterium]